MSLENTTEDDNAAAPAAAGPLIRDGTAASIVAIALALGVCVDVLFYGKSMGISWPLFTALSASGLVLSARLRQRAPAWRNLWLLGAGLLFAAMVCLRSNAALQILNFIYSVGLVVLAAAFFGGGRLSDLPLIGYVAVAGRALAEAAVRPVEAIGAGFDARALRMRGSRSTGPILRGLALSIPILVVFCALFAAADMVFAKYLTDFFRLEVLADLIEYGFRACLVLAAAWILLGWLCFALGGADDASERRSAGPGLDWARFLGQTESLVVLTTVAALFAAFVWIQFAYLFGGRTSFAELGFTYSEYARRGFFELVIAGLLTLSLILGLRTVTKLEEPVARGRQAWSFVGTTLAVLVLAMLASAHLRLSLYEIAYGYTQLRLWSHVFIGWLGLTFVWLAVSLWLKSDRFAIGALACALGFALTLDVVNPDATIAELNWDRYEETGKLDVRYLTRLSNDAVPMLVAGLDSLAPDAREILERNLALREARLASSDYLTHWQSYHLAHRRASQLIRGVDASILLPRDDAGTPEPPRHELGYP